MTADPMVVYLLAFGRGRFEIYSEPIEETIAPPPATAGFLRRWAHRAHVQWHDLVEDARRDDDAGRFARWRNRLVCRLADMIAAQRTLWALRHADRATLLFPSTLPPAQADAALKLRLVRATRHHGVWLAVDLLLFAGSAIFMPIPGPNVFAYYLAFRVVGHFQAWRGARHARSVTRWTLDADATLAELASAVDLPRDVRQTRVEELAARLNLHRLSTFFERMAA